MGMRGTMGLYNGCGMNGGDVHACSEIRRVTTHDAAHTVSGGHGVDQYRLECLERSNSPIGSEFDSTSVS